MIYINLNGKDLNLVLVLVKMKKTGFNKFFKTKKPNLIL